MRGTVIFSVIFFISFLGWRLTERLSTDALGLATGVILGILAGVPVALLLLAATRRATGNGDEYAEEMRHGRGQGAGSRNLPMHTPQPPVIILGGIGQQSGYPGQQGQPMGEAYYGPGGQGMLDGEVVDARRFHVVGDEDADVDEW